MKNGIDKKKFPSGLKGYTDKIKEVEKNKIIFGKIRIPVSESYRDLFQSYINGKTISE